MNLFYVYFVAMLISLGGTTGSIYVMGLYDNDKQSTNYTIASTFFNISLIVLLVSCILLVKDSQLSMLCAQKNEASSASGSPFAEVLV